MDRRTNIRRLICLAAALFLCLPACIARAGEVKTQWSYQYEIRDDGTVKILTYRGTDTHLKIPDTLDGCPVTAIGDGAFQIRQKLTSVTVPEGVVSIGAKAFSSCDGIKQLILPSTLKTIGNRAFSNCKGLRSVELPAGLESMGENPFALCDNLKKGAYSL